MAICQAGNFALSLGKFRRTFLNGQLNETLGRRGPAKEGYFTL